MTFNFVGFFVCGMMGRFGCEKYNTKYNWMVCWASDRYDNRCVSKQYNIRHRFRSCIWCILESYTNEKGKFFKRSKVAPNSWVFLVIVLNALVIHCSFLLIIFKIIYEKIFVCHFIFIFFAFERLGIIIRFPWY